MKKNSDVPLDFNFNFDFDFTKKEKEDKKVEDLPKMASHKAGKRHISRKMSSERVIEECLPWHFENGDCWHCISQGDVDSFSYAKALIKSHPFKYLLISTWCAAGEDFTEIQTMLDRNILEKVDIYVGEIFPKGYPIPFDMAKKIVNQCGGRLCVFRNHSKVMILKSETMTAVIESSANMNTNPRTENTVITIDKSLGDFYKNFYDNIVSFKF